MLWIIIILILFIITILATIFLFKSGTPTNFKEFLFEAGEVWRGVVSNFEDITIGMYRNKISLYPQPTRVAVLTGGNRGIGLEVLKKLLQCEMTVVLGVRNIEAARKSVESKIDSPLLMNKVIYETCDTGDLKSVREFAKRVHQQFEAINLLINNAGVMAIPYSLTKDGFETQMGVNYIGHFLLTHLLMSQLITGSKQSMIPSRVVNVSSCAHYVGKIKYDDFDCSKCYYTGSAYCDSKLAQVMFTRHLQKLCSQNKCNVQIYSCHPGIVNTEIFQYSPIGSLSWLRRILMKTPEQGSRPIVYAAISPQINSTPGIFISNCRPSRISKIAKSDEECAKLFSFTCDLLEIKNFGV